MEKAVDAGKVKAIGTSNMSAKKLAALLKDARIPPAVNQVELHPFLAQNKLKEWCARHNIVLTAFSPLGSPDRCVHNCLCRPVWVCARAHVQALRASHCHKLHALPNRFCSCVFDLALRSFFRRRTHIHHTHPHHHDAAPRA